MTTIAMCLRRGDLVRVEGSVRTVDAVTVGQAETHVAFSGTQYPPFLIAWNGGECEVTRES